MLGMDYDIECTLTELWKINNAEFSVNFGLLRWDISSDSLRHPRLEKKFVSNFGGEYRVGTHQQRIYARKGFLPIV